jgi:N-ethylmaleimide reductase
MDLFSPITVGSYTLPNRIFMAPMTRCRATKENLPLEMMIEYYTQRASAGLIISEGTQISPSGIGYPYTPGIYTADQAKEWKKITDAVHAKGGRIFVQLWHEGRVAHSSYLQGKLPVAPSRIKPEGEIFTYEGMKAFETPHALTIEEIHTLTQEYAQAAQYAIQAGFDGVEIHAANGYLLDQFLRDGTNTREDEYGGNVENRSRLLLEIIHAIYGAVPTCKIGVRLSPSGTFNSMSDSDPKSHFTAICNKLNEVNLTYVHIIDALDGDIRHGAKVVELNALRNAYKGILIANGGYDKQKAQKVINEGIADAVAFAKLFLANPDLPQRFLDDAPLNEPDTSTFYTQDTHGYTDYPALKA